MEKIFLPIFNFFKKRRVALYALFFSILIFSGYFASKIKLEEDISKILPHDEKIQKLNEVFQDSKFLDRLVVTISSADSTKDPEPDSLVAFANVLVKKIKEDLQPFIKGIQDKVDDALALEMFGSIYQNLPIYLNENDYRVIDSLTTRKTLRETLENNIRSLSSPRGSLSKISS